MLGQWSGGAGGGGYRLQRWTDLLPPVDPGAPPWDLPYPDPGGVLEPGQVLPPPPPPADARGQVARVQVGPTPITPIPWTQRRTLLTVLAVAAVLWGPKLFRR